MKDKGIKEEDIQDLLEIRMDLNLYFEPVTYRFKSLETLLSGQIFRYFVLKDMENQKQMNQLFISKATYPFILFLTVVIASCFFDQVMIPLITDSILLWSTTDSSLFFFQMSLRFFWNASAVLLILFVILLIRLQNKRFFIRFYQMFYRLSFRNFLVQYYSKQFARYYLVLYQSGCNTAQILASLKQQTTSKMVSFLAEMMDHKLTEGKDIRAVIEELPIEKSLKKMFLLGLATAETEQLLAQYVEVGQTLLMSKVDRITKTLQAVMYTIAAILIAVLYRLLMAPLSVIGQI